MPWIINLKSLTRHISQAILGLSLYLETEMLTRCIVVAIVVATSCTNAFAAEKYWRVMGASTKEPTRIRPWSGPCASLAEANVEMQILIRTHAKGGTLEFSEDKPINLSIREFSADGKITSPNTGDSDTPLTSNNPKPGALTTPVIKSVDPGGPIYSEKSPNLNGKKYFGTINGDNVTLTFGDGTVEFAGDRAGPAKYSVLITKISMQSDRTKYSGTIQGNSISGTFERIDGTESGAWSMELGDEKLFKYAGSYLVGSPTRPDRDGDISYRRIILKPNGICIDEHRGYLGYEKLQYSWTINSNGLIEFSNPKMLSERLRFSQFDSFNKVAYRADGDSLTGIAQISDPDDSPQAYRKGQQSRYPHDHLQRE